MCTVGLSPPTTDLAECRGRGVGQTGRFSRQGNTREHSGSSFCFCSGLLDAHPTDLLATHFQCVPHSLLPPAFPASLHRACLPPLLHPPTLLASHHCCTSRPPRYVLRLRARSTISESKADGQADAAWGAAAGAEGAKSAAAGGVPTITAQLMSGNGKLIHASQPIASVGSDWTEVR